MSKEESLKKIKLGVPAVGQWVKNLTAKAHVALEAAPVLSLAWHSGLKNSTVAAVA